MGERAGAARALALGQGLYRAATGAWALVTSPTRRSRAALVAGRLWWGGPRGAGTEGVQ